VEREDTFRPSLLIKPTDQLGLTVSALYQHTTMGGYNDFDIPPGCPPTPCGHYQPFNLQEPFDDTVKLLSGVLHYNASFATLTSVTSSWTRSEQQTQDASEAIENLFTGPYVAVPITELDRSEQFSQELRLTSSGDSRFQWLAGLFYSNFIYRLNDYGANTAYAEPINPDGVLLDAGVRYDTKQYAAFAEVSYQIAPFWKFTTGLRAFRYDSNLYYFESGVFAPDGPGSQFTSQGETSDHGINPKFNLAYIPNDNLTVYGTASKGFRPGGLFTPPPTSGPASCAPSLAALGFPADKTSYGSDSLWNYEIGEKARLLDGRLSVHSDIYLIRWNGIQQVVPLSCGYLIEANSGQARSYGPELEMEAVVAPGAKLTLSGAYTKAYIDHPASFLGVAPGAPVFNVPEYMASTSFDYSRPISSNLSIFGRVSETLTGPQWDVAYAVQHLPPYALTDLRVGLRSEHWTSTLFVSNATNTTAILTINNTFFTENIPDLTRATVNQPRTVGLKISWRP
jgi:outer membrane receptor protein involved in Fe transport